MNNNRWADATDLRILQPKLPDYIAARRARPKRIKVALEDIYADYFHQRPARTVVLPDIPLGTSLLPEQNAAVNAFIVTRKKQIKTWMRWHSSEGHQRSTGTSNPAATSLRALIASEHRTRQPQRYETFCRVFGEERGHKELIEAAMPPGSDISRTAQLHVRRAVLTADMAKLDDFDKARLEDAHNKACNFHKQKIHLLESLDVDEKLTAEQKQQFRDDLDDILRPILVQLAALTGWSFSVLMGGLDIDKVLRVGSMHEGVTPSGQTFAESMHNFKSQIMGPFKTFIGRVNADVLSATESVKASTAAVIAVLHDQDAVPKPVPMNSSPAVPLENQPTVLSSAETLLNISEATPSYNAVTGPGPFDLASLDFSSYLNIPTVPALGEQIVWDNMFPLPNDFNMASIPYDPGCQGSTDSGADDARDLSFPTFPALLAASTTPSPPPEAAPSTSKKRTAKQGEGSKKKAKLDIPEPVARGKRVRIKSSKVSGHLDANGMPISESASDAAKRAAKGKGKAKA
ncbi:hypothetical protein C8J56DRAFT_1062118 [Mycena floridula]|nr:hypothetical protein C8J56DRAFT_1062116 [Mycena floridula]KAJ7576412.1 hypothetical protein C8J56DRAFT_1062118 [Mycena floridula]